MAFGHKYGKLLKPKYIHEVDYTTYSGISTFYEALYKLDIINLFEAQKLEDATWHGLVKKYRIE